MDSILTSIKKMLGIAEDYEYFDTDIIIHINSIFSILTQLGVGPPEGFTISDKTSVWTDFLQDSMVLEFVKSYMFIRVRLLFDPPSSSAIIEANNKMADELSWRIMEAAEHMPGKG